MTPKGSQAHRRAAMFHAITRFRERCGAELPVLQYLRMCCAIRSGSVPHVALTRDNMRVFHVRYAGVSAYAVFNTIVDRIATFYPTVAWVIERGGKMVEQRVTA